MADGQLCAYCVTEPEAGSDVAGLRTVAMKDGDEFVLRGSKTFITNATNADFYTVLAYTAPSLRENRRERYGRYEFLRGAQRLGRCQRWTAFCQNGSARL